MTLETGWRRTNIGRRMNEAVRIFEGRIVELLREKGHAELTVAHINLTRNLDEGGTRLTELARRAALSKQAMSELVDQVERTGLVERTPDPTDGRARLVRFTPKGRVWLTAFQESLDTAEGEMRRALGNDTVDLMVRDLGAYVASHADDDTAPARLTGHVDS